ncbi:MAG: transposase [Caldilineaceae bacterium SB0664_bin_22]|nr:transposase [Caldilineaceae bacterium SB0664_bin_22]MYC63726.1 transposase [Caldilineaceae bacterium SB0661_bin_34]
MHSQGLNAAKHDRLARLVVLYGKVRVDAWQRCSGVSAVLQSPYDIRDAWMAEGYDWHGLPARLGNATLADALGDIGAAREASKVPVKKAIRHRTRGNSAERERLYNLLKQNRWTEDSFLHRQMRKQWRGGRSHVTNQIVADAGSYTTQVWHDRAWVYLQGLERGQRIAIPLKGTHLPSGTLRILLRDNGQVEVHYAVDEAQVCSTRPCGKATVGVDKAGTIACEDLSVSMKSARYRHRDTNRRLNGWVKGVMADTLTSISRRRGSALALANPAYTSQVDSRTGLLQGRRRWDRFYCLDGVVLDADVNAACNILARLDDEEITLYIPYKEVRALLAERTRTAVGTAPRGLELRGRAMPFPSTESESPEPVLECTR